MTLGCFSKVLSPKDWYLPTAGSINVEYFLPRKYSIQYATHTNATVLKFWLCSVGWCAAAITKPFPVMDQWITILFAVCINIYIVVTINPALKTVLMAVKIPMWLNCVVQFFTPTYLCLNLLAYFGLSENCIWSFALFGIFFFRSPSLPSCSAALAICVKPNRGQRDAQKVEAVGEERNWGEWNTKVKGRVSEDSKSTF